MTIIKMSKNNNKEKTYRIDILNHEFDVISGRYNYFKGETTARIEDLEGKIFNENHLIDKYKKDVDELNRKNLELETNNNQRERDIARNKLFNKKNDEIKIRKDEDKKRGKKMQDLNDLIGKFNMNLLLQKMKLDDKDLIK
jgi:predicted RNase H-like nuclease (RuvC/YqgF family)